MLYFRREKDGGEGGDRERMCILQMLSWKEESDDLTKINKAVIRKLFLLCKYDDH